MRKFFLTFFFLSFLFLLPFKTFAASNFAITSNAAYTVRPNGMTHVGFSLILTNLTDTYYAPSFTMLLGFSHVSNTLVRDSRGLIVPVLKATSGGQELTIPFHTNIIGLNKTVPFTVSFDTSDVTRKYGGIWEVTIPGLADVQDFSDFHIHVTVPDSFGKPSYIKPEFIGVGLDFNKDQLHKGGIAIGFGDKQVYHFHLLYHVVNKNVFPVTTEIALPPNTNYQDVFIQSMNPRPSNVYQDAEGNWLASYSLIPSQKVTIAADGIVTVHGKPSSEVLSPMERASYLKEQKYWEVNAADIKKLAVELKTPYSIYQYVVNRLQYDYSRVSKNQSRLGAEDVLNHPNSAVCLEFTDLFIALTRAAGIPAREIDGFAYTDNPKDKPLSRVQDILHAWPEYYDSDKRTWVMVDPTWGNTTGGFDYFHSLDFDHVAFVIKGMSSTYPLPAGAYKLAGQEMNKDVNVIWGNMIVDTKPKVKMSIDLPAESISLFPLRGNIVLQNLGSVAVPVQSVSIISHDLMPRIQQVMSETVPPFGSYSIPFEFERQPLLTNKNVTVTIQGVDHTLSKTVHIYPFVSKQTLMVFLICVTASSIIIFIIAIRARRLFIRRRK